MALFKKRENIDIFISFLTEYVPLLKEWKNNVLNDGSSTPVNLAIFSQLHTFDSVLHLLSEFRDILDDVNILFLELRFYYDSLSQLYFVENGRDYGDVLEFYGKVKGYQDESYKMLFENNPSLEEYFGDVVHRHIVNEIISVNDYYIQDIISKKIKTMLKNELFDKMVKSLELDGDILYHVHKLWHRLLTKGVYSEQEFYTETIKHMYDKTLDIKSDEILINYNWDNKDSFK